MLILLLQIIALVFIAFNVTKVDIENPFKEESLVALITILGSFCVILLMQILKLSKRIESQQKNKK